MKLNLVWFYFDNTDSAGKFFVLPNLSLIDTMHHPLVSLGKED